MHRTGQVINCYSLVQKVAITRIFIRVVESDYRDVMSIQTKAIRQDRRDFLNPADTGILSQNKYNVHNVAVLLDNPVLDDPCGISTHNRPCLYVFEDSCTSSNDSPSTNNHTHSYKSISSDPSLVFNNNWGRD